MGVLNLDRLANIVDSDAAEYGILSEIGLYATIKNILVATFQIMTP